jgi:hypothetical protein
MLGIIFAHNSEFKIAVGLTAWLRSVKNINLKETHFFINKRRFLATFGPWLKRRNVV